MKSLTTLTELLTYVLEGMYQTEKQLQTACPEILEHAAADSLKARIGITQENSLDNRLRLKRMFSYLLAGHTESKASVVELMLKDLHPIPGLTKSPRLGDVLINTALRSLACYRASEYSAARDIALQLNLETVVALLDQIISQTDEEWKGLVVVALMEINQKVVSPEC